MLALRSQVRVERLKQRKKRDCSDAVLNGGSHSNQDAVMSDDAHNGGCFDLLP